MKKAIALMLMAGTCLSANSVFAADGTISFSGNIVSDACKVTVADADQTVTMGDVATTAFTAAGDKASPTTFKIDLTGCAEAVDHVSVKFDGVSDTTDTNLLSLDKGQTAKGVGIEISDAQGNAIPLHTSSPDYPVDSDSGTATLNFSSRYVATATTVGAGTASGTSQFTINYQ
jgi:major type 1 subunit fimbrin (pilin)